jgi:hypothetical protein
VLSDLQNGLKEGLNISGKDLAKLIIEETRRQPLGNLYMETLSAIDMEKIGLLVDKIKNLQTLLMSEGVSPENIKKAATNIRTRVIIPKTTADLLSFIFQTPFYPSHR